MIRKEEIAKHKYPKKKTSVCPGDGGKQRWKKKLREAFESKGCVHVVFIDSSNL